MRLQIQKKDCPCDSQKLIIQLHPSVAAAASATFIIQSGSKIINKVMYDIMS